MSSNIFKKTWPYWIGGILLGILNTLLLFVVNKTFKITSGFLYWGANILNKFKIDIYSWEYFKDLNITKENVSQDFYTILIIAIILGSLLSALLATEFKIKKIKNKKQFLFALIGGIIMGYGTRLSYGCNIGAFFSAIPSFSLHGWVYPIFMFLGAFIGSRILLKYIL